MGSGHRGFTLLRASLRRGFTLIELLIVIAILAILISFTLFKFRPFQRFAQAYDVQRKSDIRQMQNALLQAMISGLLPQNIPEIQGSSKAICQYSYRGLQCTDPPVSGADLSYLVPDYLASIPKNPIYGSGATTGYKIHKEGSFFVIESVQ